MPLRFEGVAACNHSSVSPKTKSVTSNAIILREQAVINIIGAMSKLPKCLSPGLPMIRGGYYVMYYQTSIITMHLIANRLREHLRPYERQFKLTNATISLRRCLCSAHPTTAISRAASSTSPTTTHHVQVVKRYAVQAPKPHNFGNDTDVESSISLQAAIGTSLNHAGDRFPPEWLL
jgi:hypothetical protein